MFHGQINSYLNIKTKKSSGVKTVPQRKSSGDISIFKQLIILSKNTKLRNNVTLKRALYTRD